MHKRFWWGDLRNKDQLEDLNVDGRIKLKWLFKKRDGEARTELSCQDRDRWRALVNAVMKLRVP